MGLRLINSITGIQGVNPGGVGSIDIPCNCRLHDLRFFCTSTVGGVPNTLTPLVDFLESQEIIVNGVTMRNIVPADIENVSARNALPLNVGEIVNYFTEPWRKGLLADEATSWDLLGQRQCTIKFNLTDSVVAPAIVGMQTFDFQQNLRPAPPGYTGPTIQRNGKGMLPFLAPIKQLSQSYNVAAGPNTITTLAIDYPIQRLYIFPDTADTLQHIEIYADGVKIVEGDLLATYGPTDLLSVYDDYGIVRDLSGACVLIPFDYSNKIGDVLTIAKNLQVKIWSSVQQSVRFMMENRPSSYV